MEHSHIVLYEGLLQAETAKHHHVASMSFGLLHLTKYYQTHSHWS